MTVLGMGVETKKGGGRGACPNMMMGRGRGALAGSVPTRGKRAVLQSEWMGNAWVGGAHMARAHVLSVGQSADRGTQAVAGLDGVAVAI